MCPTEIGREGAGWIELAQDWDKWRAVVGAVMILQVLRRSGFLEQLRKDTAE